MAIAVVGMLDEREQALSIIIAHIEKRGHKSLLIDISIGTGAITSSLTPEITCGDLARVGGGESHGQATEPHRGHDGDTEEELVGAAPGVGQENQDPQHHVNQQGQQVKQLVRGHHAATFSTTRAPFPPPRPRC